MEVSGAAQIKAAFDKVVSAMANKIVGSALTKSLQPIVNAAKASAPEDTGTLKFSIAKKIKKYSEVVVGLVGADKKIKSTVGNKKSWPAKYLHLVEYGHVLKRGGNTIGFVAPKPFLRRAYESNKKQAATIFADEVKKGIEKG